MKKRNVHNLSHYRLTTFQPGELIPVGCVEVVPGDTFDHEAAVLLRCSPLLAPVMHRAQVRVHHFYVPNRIIWNASLGDSEGWEDFITQPPQSDDFEVPSYNAAGSDIGSSLFRLYEHLGCPLHTLTGAGSISLSQLPVRAYWSIWNEWYRDQDLQPALSIVDFSDPDVGIQNVCWRKDDFTAARLTPQLGADVTLPLGSSAPVVPSGTDTPTFTVSGDAGGPGALFRGTNSLVVAQGSTPNDAAALVWANPSLEADLSGATAATLQALREASATQRQAERMMNFGHRYPELLLSYGVKSSDGRLSRPEYLGGGKTMISFSEVLQTSNGSTGPDDVVGSMYGHGIAPAKTQRYRRFFEEHGYVISLISVVPQSIYANAIPRHFFKGHNGGADLNNRLTDDYYTPELEQIGMQPILDRELCASDNGQTDVFGYGPRYYENRHQPSQVVGEFMPGRSLDYFTWARSFTGPPTLNSDFVLCEPSDRIFADQSGTDVLWCAVNHRLVARRLLTKKTVGRIL